MSRAGRALIALLVAALGVGVPATAGAVAADAATTLAYEGDAITVEPEPGQVIRGESDRPPGTNLSVRVRATDAASPFLMVATATVAENGTFGATFDLSDVPAGTAFDVVVHHNGTRLAEASGEVVACAGNCSTESGPSGSDSAPASDPGGGPTPSLTVTDEPQSGFPVPVAGALAVGGVLGVVGVALLLGVIDL